MTSTVPPTPDAGPGTPAAVTEPSLRTRSLTGAIALSVRQVIGIVLGLGGVLVLTHELGPYGYGVYAIALGIAIWMQTLADWGVGVYLVRLTGDQPIQLIEAQAFAVLMLLGVGGSLAGVGILLAWGHLLWVHQAVTAAIALIASTPVALAAQVPMARLEREMAYGQVATVEVSSQLSLYLVAIPLVFLGAGPWGPVLGLVVSRVVLLLGAAIVTRWRPRFHWDAATAKDVLGYGFGYSASVTVWQLRGLALPLIVGPLAGPAAAGQVALTVRLVEIAGFVRAATWRLGLAALVRVQHDAGRTCRAVRDGAVLQVAALGVILGGLALLAGPVLGTLFDARWTPIEQLFPLVAFGSIANAAFNLHSSALYARRFNWSVTWFHVSHVVLFLGVGAVAVHFWGITGYGLAELAALPAYAVLLVAFRRRIGSVELPVVLPWLIAAGGPLALPILGPASLLLLLAPALPVCRRASAELAASIVSALAGRTPWRLRSAS
ncbi:MAG: hypothetical protein QOC98_1958 [Frankiaceae bacterium]|nr:hypothetical protein [Frankiaceae bacterium]